MSKLVTGPFSSPVHKVGTWECTCNDWHYWQALKKENTTMLRRAMKLGNCMRPCRSYYETCDFKKKKAKS